jgi:carbon starvation protein
VLLGYCFVASVLPVWLLLQPRDYINSHQLFVALALLFGGLLLAHPQFVAPAVNQAAPADAPPIFPFLFITVACGAISGFHCLVSSGTSSKQVACEPDAQFIGYGAMLLEGMLAVLVIIACCAGIGMGVYTFDPATGAQTPVLGPGGAPLTGEAAWLHRYGGDWASMTLGRKVGAFVEGGANMVAVLGVPLQLAVAIIAVMVACFAATTLDTATRLQRYVLQEIGNTLRIRPLQNKYAATFVAVATGGALALWPGPQGPGSGGLILWPLFGATNQLLAGLAFLVVAFYLLRHSRPVWFLLAPLALMVIVPAWGLVLELMKWRATGNWLLVGIGAATLLLQGWMVVEGAVLWRSVRGVLPEPLPRLAPAPATMHERSNA